MQDDKCPCRMFKEQLEAYCPTNNTRHLDVVPDDDEFEQTLNFQDGGQTGDGVTTLSFAVHVCMFTCFRGNKVDFISTRRT